MSILDEKRSFLILFSIFLFSDSVYSSNQALSNNVYSDSSTPLDDKMDTIDHILLERPSNGTVCNTVINPIDKLYSMQSSYFSTE